MYVHHVTGHCMGSSTDHLWCEKLCEAMCMLPMEHDVEHQCFLLTLALDRLLIFIYKASASTTCCKYHVSRMNLRGLSLNFSGASAESDENLNNDRGARGWVSKYQDVQSADRNHDSAYEVGCVPAATCAQRNVPRRTHITVPLRQYSRRSVSPDLASSCTGDVNRTSFLQSMSPWQDDFFLIFSFLGSFGIEVSGWAAGFAF